MRRIGSLLLLVALYDESRLLALEPPPSLPPGVEITNLYDAFGPEQPGLSHDFGFSAIVRYGEYTVLFDAGTDARRFEANLRALEIDLREVDVAIVSHGHYDHIGGLDYLLSVNPGVRIYLPNDFFSLGAPTRFPFRETEPDLARTLPEDQQYFRGERVIEGMVTVPTGRFWKSDATWVTEATEILPGITVIPTTSELMGTFIKYPPFEKHPQFIGIPELSVTLSTGDGEVLVVGCSHSTVESIIQEVQRIRPGKIKLVAGGFHLIPYSRDYVESLAQRMRDVYDVESVAPAHCTGHLGFSIFRETFEDNYEPFGLGQTISIPSSP